MPARNTHGSAGHAVLLGDSIFDNAAYVPGGPDVVRQLRGALPPDWRASLLAVDGEVIAGVKRQLRSLPSDATHLVVSVGGNDALQSAYLLDEKVATVAAALVRLSAAQRQFAAAYDAMLEAVTAVDLPVAVCTIYDTPPGEPNQPVIRTALAVFNDCITRAAFSRRVPLIDLRLICDEDADYANPIEPSVQGGAKIARAVASLLTNPDLPRSAVVV
ncbi:SGNH/GDSL hydrolase family protein [Arthrobacter crusticola]|uniref:SGNH/GDSL hydrolase family protein n=1 Tax=Arthrobacter crusticola TaxID=2547960 RepID=A0A4R5U370_9MICC|nr:SGNH/GDSL hydrolase family protein [Arthrobacter crusticola]TDK28125.1 SGNH/GDSL hydrolase family protein [Arthrobacter crusticola]